MEIKQSPNYEYIYTVIFTKEEYAELKKLLEPLKTSIEGFIEDQLSAAIGLLRKL